ncbi:hypothetical protein [Paucidesulfovibrio longus]|uniref:hypothetical protein n=1 Tax=Paucidesulfovibrio longus TaxID=889 RepID=UPI0003B4F184|nr:hypothetical protein [Paucidesulfovibrio longus]
MQERTKKYLDPKPPRRKPHSHVRDLLLVLLGVGLVIIFFSSQSRFNFTSRNMTDKERIVRKVVYDGELEPKNLGLSPEQLRPLDDLLAEETRNLRQIRIHIERQDRYEKLSDGTELRFWCVLTLDNGSTVRTVISRTRRDGLISSLTRRIRDDLEKYRSSARKMGKERIDSFTNTM